MTVSGSLLSIVTMPSTVCPTSNVVIANRFRSLAEHPLREMRAVGLLVTINTDDPAMEDLDLGQEYRNVAEACGMSIADMAQLAIEGIESTWLDGSERAVLAHEFREAAAGLWGGSAAR